MARRKTSYDPLFDEPEGAGWGRYALIAAIVVIIGFVLYGALAGPREGQGPVPLIRADETPWTRAPSEAGGMEIPNQDSTVFELMDKEPEKEIVADAATEVKEEKEELKADEKAEEEVAEKKEEPKEEVKEEKKAETEKPTLDSLVDEAMAPKAKEEEVIGAAKEEPKPEEAKKEEPAPAPVKKDMVRVRLGAVPGTATSEAQAEFTRLKGLAGGQLSGFSPSFETVNLPKGSFVRINVPMERMDAARLCDTLSSKGAPCLILSE